MLFIATRAVVANIDAALLPICDLGSRHMQPGPSGECGYKDVRLTEFVGVLPILS